MTIDLRLFLRGRNIALDLFLTVVLFIGFFLVIAGAVPSLTWNADDWYNNDDSSDSGFQITTPSGTQQLDPPHNNTPCPGFPSCTAQDTFTTKTHHRGVVELVGAAFTGIAAYVDAAFPAFECFEAYLCFLNSINHIILFIWAAARTRKCAGLKSTEELGELQAVIRRT